MSLTADDWLGQVRVAVQCYFPDAPVQVEVVRHTRVTVRVEIGRERFADLFFREETERTDYALIVDGKRVFGIDNLGGWHEHPLSDAGIHRPCPAPTPMEAMQRLREANDSLAPDNDDQ